VLTIFKKWSVNIDSNASGWCCMGWHRSSWILGGRMPLTATSHRTKCKGGVINNHRMISFLHKPEYIYHILHINCEHYLLNIVSREETVSFAIAAFTSMGLLLCHCCIVSHTCARASEQLIMTVDHLNTMNRWVSYLAVCLHHDLIGW